MDLQERVSNYKDKWSDALLSADSDRNGGMAMELLCVEGYADQDGVSAERYVINILRAERERRQKLDEIARDKLEMDEVIDGAMEAGITGPEWIAQRLSEGKFANGTVFRPEDVSAYFLAKLSKRLMERLTGTSPACYVRGPHAAHEWAGGARCAGASDDQA